jgi:arginyl-tRNA synthetase
LGGVLAKILQSVGYTVKQYFYVNDLGFQIGLTAIGYESIKDKIDSLKGTTKSDQFIGRIYAVMNTFHELQGLGFQPMQVEEMITKDQEPTLAEKSKSEKLAEYISIYKNLKEQYPTLLTTLLESCKDITNIKEAAGNLNLKYEQRDPEAVKIYRKMVGECLAGVQQTLDIYNIKHDHFDYESELGWDGQNEKILNILKQSPYFVPQTQCNASGMPEGAYFNLEKFIKDKKLDVKIPKHVL